MAPLRRLLRLQRQQLLLTMTMVVASTLSLDASAVTQKFAVLIAAHDGGDGLPKLRYAGRDATRLADVLVDVGGFARADIVSMVDGDTDTVRDLVAALSRRVDDSKHAGNDVVVLVYYSGHAQDGRLRLGNETFAMSELRTLLHDTAGDVRLAFVDACGAGAMTRDKGATLAAPFVIKIDEQLSTTGQVIIASSSANEVSQESDEIQGSFFTHYLTTGLRGDADRDRDGKVTLDEAYAYAYGRTVAATSATRAGAQHPTYAFDLKGAGDVVLTTPGGADVVVEFPGDLEGRYFVVDLDRQLFVAEVDKLKGGRSEIALPRGQYAIKKRLDSHLLMTRVQARSKGRIVVDDATMETVSFADDYAKGSVIAVEDTLKRPIGWSLAVGGGVQSVSDPSGHDDGGLFPTTGVLVGHVRVHHLLRSQLTVDLDVGWGNTAATRVVDGGALGTASFDVDVTAWQAGTAVLWEQPLRDVVGLDVTAVVGPRMAGLLYVHRFVGDSCRWALTSRRTWRFRRAWSRGLAGRFRRGGTWRCRRGPTTCPTRLTPCVIWPSWKASRRYGWICEDADADATAAFPKKRRAVSKHHDERERHHPWPRWRAGGLGSGGRRRRLRRPQPGGSAVSRGHPGQGRGGGGAPRHRGRSRRRPRLFCPSGHGRKLRRRPAVRNPQPGPRLQRPDVFPPRHRRRHLSPAPFGTFTGTTGLGSAL